MTSSPCAVWSPGCSLGAPSAPVRSEPKLCRTIHPRPKSLPEIPSGAEAPSGWSCLSAAPCLHRSRRSGLDSGRPSVPTPFGTEAPPGVVPANRARGTPLRDRSPSEAGGVRAAFPPVRPKPPLQAPIVTRRPRWGIAKYDTNPLLVNLDRCLNFARRPEFSREPVLRAFGASNYTGVVFVTRVPYDRTR